MKKVLAQGATLAAAALLLFAPASLASAAETTPPGGVSAQTVERISIPEGSLEFVGQYGHTVTCELNAAGTLATNVQITYEAVGDAPFEVVDVHCAYPAVGATPPVNTEAPAAPVAPAGGVGSAVFSERVPLSFGLLTATGKFGDVVSCRDAFASYPTEAVISYENNAAGVFEVTGHDCLSPNGVPAYFHGGTIVLADGALSGVGVYGHTFECSVNEAGAYPTMITVQYVSWSEPASYAVAWRDCHYEAATPAKATAVVVEPPASATPEAVAPVEAEATAVVDAPAEVAPAEDVTPEAVAPANETVEAVDAEAVKEEAPVSVPAPSEAPRTEVNTEATNTVASEEAQKQDAEKALNRLPNAGGDQSLIVIALSVAVALGLASLLGFALTRRNRLS